VDDQTIKDGIEAAKHGSKALENITDIINKLAGPLASELGMVMADKARAYRVQNWIRVQMRIAEMLREANAELHAIPPRQFLPMLEAAGLEDDSTLQELWAALIANAAIADEQLPSAFITFLKELSPLEGQLLNKVWEVVSKKFDEVHGTEPDGYRHALSPNFAVFDRPQLVGYLTILQLQQKMQLAGNTESPLRAAPEPFFTASNNLVRLGIFEQVEDKVMNNRPGFNLPQFRLTALGWWFINSCQPPAKVKKERFFAFD
jgi:hypothetical protein